MTAMEKQDAKMAIAALVESFDRDQEFDQLVYKLYGLTQHEMTIVEESTR
jgi:hypothetical protein